eukprot:358729-Chlamydomonas_euryale.AAC.2
MQANLPVSLTLCALTSCCDSNPFLGRKPAPAAARSACLHAWRPDSPRLGVTREVRARLASACAVPCRAGPPCTACPSRHMQARAAPRRGRRQAFSALSRAERRFCRDAGVAVTLFPSRMSLSVEQNERPLGKHSRVVEMCLQTGPSPGRDG